MPTTIRPKTGISIVAIAISIAAGGLTLGRVVAAKAQDIRPTVYDDGLACPEDCDAHVVFESRLNGTANASSPDSSRIAPKKCDPNHECRICFSSDDASCITAMYRGAGPSGDIFDFTPAFYRSVCDRDDVPQAIKDQCREMRLAEARWKGLINCILNASDLACIAAMQAADQAKAADRLFLEQCRTLGSDAFNAKYERDKTRQRSSDCLYEAHPTAKNSKGVRWARLLPSSCPDTTYVGRDGLDCCSGDTFIDASLGRECRIFYKPSPP